MERKISLKDLEQAVTEAYETYKSSSVDGLTSDSRITPAPKADDFGISVVLTDGRTVSKADSKTPFALGKLARVPVVVTLLSQNAPDELKKKAGCCCKEQGSCDGKQKVKISLGAKAVRAVSRVEPTGDAIGKYDVLMSTLLNLTENEPVLNDDLYKTLAAQAESENAAMLLTEAGYVPEADVKGSLDVFEKLNALQMTAEQVAVMGATIAADGRNPRSGEYAFDGSRAANIVGVIASRGLGKKMSRMWNMSVGAPAIAGFGGGFLAILPGFGAIAAYSPEVNAKGVSPKAAHAVAYIAKKLGLNVYASARVTVE